MVEGECGLCGTRGPLVLSHLIPAALYRLARCDDPPAGIGHDPICLSPRGTVQTSRQVRMPFLCGTCDARFSERGERVVIAECFRGNTRFSLREKLQHSVPQYRRGDGVWYTAMGLPSVNTRAYRYFAASMIWRTSAGFWSQLPDGVETRTLDPQDEMMFARYLLDKERFPGRARLLLLVAKDSDPFHLSSVPTVKRDVGFDIHSFYVPGVEFRLFLDHRVDPCTQPLFDIWSADMLFLLHDSWAAPPTAEVVREVRGSPLRGKLAERNQRGKG